MTPHLETVRRKFGEAFAAWYADTYHRGLNIEYLSFGGGEIVKFFQASEAIYERSGTYNVDVVWGGSDSLFSDALGSKYLQTVALGPGVLEAAFPTPDIGGVPLYDVSAGGPRWFGAALSSFGIMYNRDVLTYLRLPEPRTWADLADPRYSGWLELADPTRSASAKAALQVIVEREIETAAQEHRPQEQAWAHGMGLIRQIAANAKGFTQAANELPGTVSNGDVAAAMSIDFYARAQIAAIGGCATRTNAPGSDGAMRGDRPFGGKGTLDADAALRNDRSLSGDGPASRMGPLRESGTQKGEGSRDGAGQVAACVARVGYVEPRGAPW